MKVIIACEFSGIVREEFKKLGHDVLSCDLLPTEIPGNHWEGDIFECLKFHHYNFDLMIAHPPCTYLSNAGIGWFNESKYGDMAINRKQKRNEAFKFFTELMESEINHVCIENPVGYVNHLIRPTQIIQPYYWGDPFIKRTCLWLKNLPKLTYQHCNDLFSERSTVIPEYYFVSSGSNYKTKKLSNSMDKRNQKIRSKTFPGIAKAMAEQWTEYLTK